jgi:hypothetical protein
MTPKLSSWGSDKPLETHSCFATMNHLRTSRIDRLSAGNSAGVSVKINGLPIFVQWYLPSLHGMALGMKPIASWRLILPTRKLGADITPQFPATTNTLFNCSSPPSFHSFNLNQACDHLPRHSGLYLSKQQDNDCRAKRFLATRPFQDCAQLDSPGLDGERRQ